MNTTAERRNSNARSIQRRGVTLVELLVVIGIISVLLGITLPNLHSARAAARQATCVSNLKGIGVSMGVYLADHQGAYPFTKGGAGVFYAANPDGSSSQTIPHPWSLREQWPLLMHAAAPWESHFESWACPGSPRSDEAPWRIGLSAQGGGTTPLTSYAYSQSFVANPAVWSGGVEADESLLRAVRDGEVRSPALKVLMFDSEMAHVSVRKPATLDARPMLFADYHSEIKSVSSATAPVYNPFTGRRMRLHDTPMGVWGRDY